MYCDVYPIERREDGWQRFRCHRCGRESNWSPHGPGGIEVGRVSLTCRSFPRWHEFGHWAALFLGELGVTRRRYVAVKAWLGLAPKCGCQRREEVMNRWGERLRAVVGRLVRR